MDKEKYIVQGDLFPTPTNQIKHQDTATIAILERVNSLVSIIPTNSPDSISQIAIEQLEQRAKTDAIQYNAMQLVQIFNLYLQAASAAPFYVKDMIKAGMSAGEWSSTETRRPLTLQAFCSFAGITQRKFTTQYLNSKDANIAEVAQLIKEHIESHIADNALAGINNAQFATRILGLQDKREIEVNSTHTERRINIQLDSAPIDLTKRSKLQSHAEDATEV